MAATPYTASIPFWQASTSAIRSTKKAAGINFIELTQRAVAHFARHVGDMFHYGSHGAAVRVAGGGVPLNGGLGAAMLTAKATQTTIAKFDGILLSGGRKASDAITDILKKGPSRFGNLNDLKLEKIYDILYKGGTTVKWTDGQLESLLRVTTKYGDNLASGPMKHIDDLSGIEGIQRVVDDLVNPKYNPKGFETELKVASEYIGKNNIDELSRFPISNVNKPGMSLDIDIIKGGNPPTHIEVKNYVRLRSSQKSKIKDAIDSYKANTPNANYEIYMPNSLKDTTKTYITGLGEPYSTMLNTNKLKVIGYTP